VPCAKARQAPASREKKEKEKERRKGRPPRVIVAGDKTISQKMGIVENCFPVLDSFVKARFGLGFVDQRETF